MKSTEVKLLDRYGVYVAIDYTGEQFDTRYRYKDLSFLVNQDEIGPSKLPFKVGDMAKAVLKRLEMDRVNVNFHTFSKTMIMHPAIFLQDRSWQYKYGIQGAIGEVINEIAHAFPISGDLAGYLDAVVDPSEGLFFEADVNSELLSTPDKDQALDYFLTRKRSLASGEWVYSFIKTGEVKTYYDFELLDRARNAFSSVIRDIAHAAYLPVDPESGSSTALRGMILNGVDEAVSEYLRGGGRSKLDQLFGSEIGPSQGYTRSNGGAFIVGRTTGTSTSPGTIMVIPQIDQALPVKLADGTTIFPNSKDGKTVVVLIQRTGDVKIGEEMGTSNFKVKVGKIDSANFICTRTDNSINKGSIRVKSKTGTEIYPMIFAADGKTLIPNPAFWQGTDVNMQWSDVPFDSFKTTNPDPLLPLTVSSIGAGKIPVTYDDITDMRDEVVKILFPGAPVKGKLGQMFDSFAVKMRGNWLYAMQESGGILEPYTKLPRSSTGRGQQPALSRDATGTRTVEEEFEKNHDRAVERNIRFGRQLAPMVYAELIMSMVRADRGIEPGALPASFIGRHFQTGEDATELAGDTYVSYIEPDDPAAWWERFKAGEIKTSGVQVLLDCTDLERIRVIEEETGQYGEINTFATVMTRAGLGEGKVAQMIEARREKARRFFEKLDETPNVRAEQILGADLINSDALPSYSQLFGMTEEAIAELSPEKKAALFDKQSLLTDEMYNRWLRKANDVLDFIIKTMPGAETMNMDLIQSRIQSFQTELDAIRREGGHVYVEGSVASASLGRPILANYDVMYRVLNAWRAIWRDGFSSMIPQDLDAIGVDPALKDFKKFVDQSFKMLPVVPDPSSCTWFRVNKHDLLQDTTLQVTSWIAGVLDPGDKNRRMMEAIMFPEFTRIDARVSFKVLVMNNEVWKVGNMAGPIGGKYYFEVYLEENVGGVMVPVEESRRVGSFNAAWGHFEADPMYAGVTMYVDWGGGRAPSMSWVELEASEFDIPEDINKIEHVFSFWEALPENY
ncbi:MAG: hypothetical protein GYA24_02765 [Candidatus Lokiarchaeota archaeon]|nr:hypothetical protein [Candidatus Lokiarchaeota archaeon]